MSSPIKGGLKKIFTGLSVPQEYLCLQSDNLIFPIRVFVTTPLVILGLEVTNTHIFLGYKPVVIALNDELALTGPIDLSGEDEICLHFGTGPFETNTQWMDYPADSKSVARLVCRKADTKQIGESIVYFFKGVHGEHAFISPFHQWLNRQVERVKIRKEGNIDLSGNLYDQVRIAYSVPREISIVTVSNGKQINMFPTDLHGAITEEYYCGSLRMGGEVNRQIEAHVKIVISSVHSHWYREAYALGKNHMRGLRTTSDFALHNDFSQNFGLPLPAGVVKYRELKRMDSIDFGIHRIHVYSTYSLRTLIPDALPLSHIHHYYMQWRIDQGLQTNYLLR